MQRRTIDMFTLIAVDADLDAVFNSKDPIVECTLDSRKIEHDARAIRRDVDCRWHRGRSGQR